MHRLGASGAWQSFDLPVVEGQPVESTALSFAGKVPWVVAKTASAKSETHYLFGPTAPRDPTVFPSRSDVHYTEGDSTGPLPATAACGDLLVVLRRMVTPGQKFKDVAGKLAGNAELGGVEAACEGSDSVGYALVHSGNEARAG